MADVKISQLPVAAALDGTEIFPIVQGGVTVQVTLASLAPQLAALLPPAINAPTNRTLVMSTAYQATNAAKSSHVTLNFKSTSTLTISGGITSGTANVAKVVVGPTSSVVTSQDYVVGNYTNTSTGTLLIGINLTQIIGDTCSFVLPPGWYFAIIPVSGTVTLDSASDQQIG